MDSTILIPLLFPMETAFEDLGDGCLIRVLRPGGEHVGILRVTRQTETGHFGAIVHFGPFGVISCPTTSPVGDPGFAATGHSGLPLHRLTLEELRRIERTHDAEVPFTLDATQS